MSPNPSVTPRRVSRERLLEFLGEMLVIRRFEEKVGRTFPRG